MAHPSERSHFQLESLESRTLLAGDAAALSSDGAFLTNYDPTSTAADVVIATAAGGNLVIDASLLPGTVKNLKISGFTTVTINGHDKFTSLELLQIGTFSGVDVDVSDSLKVTDVAAVKLHSLSGFGWLYGTDSRLDVFDSRSATLYSTLDHLTLSSSNNVILISGNPHQEIRLEFPSGKAELLGTTEKVIKAGDLPAGTVNNFHVPNSAYTVIILSLSSAAGSETLLTRLQEALAQGNPDNAKTAFADYVKSLYISESTYALTFATTSAAEISLGAVGRAPLVAGSVDDPAVSGTHLDSLRPSAPDTARPVSAAIPVSAHSVVDSTSTPEVHPAPSDAAAALLSTAESRNPPTSAAAEVGEPRHSSSEATLLIESVRATLTNLVASVDAGASTVSAYIIDRVGTELEPGMLPGLLVDARGVRGRRDAAAWTQL